MISSAASCIAAIFAAGPIATLPTMTVPVIMVGSVVVGPAPATAQTYFPFGAPVPRKDETPIKTEARSKSLAPAAVITETTAEVATSSVPVAAQVSAAPVVGATTWRVELADVNVRRVIERWSRAAGIQVVYEATKDVDVGAAAAFAGTYEHALQQLLGAIESSEMPLRACLYANAVARVIPRMQRCD